MSKPLENMTLEELSQYMKQHQDNSNEWQKAYNLFAQKSDWQDTPEDATWEEQKQFVEDFISQVI
jgi:DNA replication protein DnaD